MEKGKTNIMGNYNPSVCGTIGLAVTRSSSSSPSSWLRGPEQELEVPHNSGESPGMKPRLELGEHLIASRWSRLERWRGG